MKAVTEYNIKLEEKAGIICQRFAPLESFGFLESGFILGYKDGKKINPQNIPKIISIVTGIPEKKFKVVIPRQVHQAGVKIFREKFPEEIKDLGCDALITDQEDLVLVVQIADCLPVFLVDDKKKLVGLAHIGWRGALLGIAERFVKQASGSSNADLKDLNLILGPSIGNCCYEISDSLAVLIDDKKYLKKRDTGKYLDFKNLVKDRFLKSGVREENIFISEECTCCGDKLYQSYRRDREKAGRMLAFIGKVKKG